MARQSVLRSEGEFVCECGVRRRSQAALTRHRRGHHRFAVVTKEMVEQAEVDYTEHLIREALKRPPVLPVPNLRWEKAYDHAGTKTVGLVINELPEEPIKAPESKPITGGEWSRFLNPGAPDEYDHDAEVEFDD